MNILAIESSAGPASCAVYRDGKLLACSSINTGLTHSQTLIPMVSDTLKNAGLDIKNIDLYAVAAGPGSFTGIRIGVAAVKGLAFTDKKPCIGVSTLAAMTRMTQGIPFDGIVCAAMDARCNQVYTALFENHSGEIKRLTQDSALHLDDLKKLIEATKKNVLFIGDGSQLCYNAFGGLREGMFLAPPMLRYQNAAGVALEAAETPESAVSAEQLMPVYLRLPQAERELKRRQSVNAAD
ncbi:MAG: tRNA (adenosine(37)-N6)-threonylcarbamoyltransferase complex dimerization subunit type 1 TsaB [Clostridiales bacterium]|jgi:tRNA threonylcarbamoyladenosine biosynthesis protein TsaB|nr:tRNA (adenosine(37)-N6)-threonylcarbamoyltransferase complex dimerization subunit type 1 TsaB [Clostridiales bacterium]